MDAVGARRFVESMQTALAERCRAEPQAELAVFAKYAAVGIAEQRRCEHGMSSVSELQNGVGGLLFELLAVSARRQAEAENAVARRATRAGVPQRKATV